MHVKWLSLPFSWVNCKSASNLDPTPIVHQIIEAEPELFISGVFDRRPTVTPVFLENRLTATRYSDLDRGPSWTPIYTSRHERKPTLYWDVDVTAG